MVLIAHSFFIISPSYKKMSNGHIFLNKKNKEKYMMVTVHGKYTRALTFQNLFFLRRLFEVSKIKPGGFAEKSGM